MQKGFAPIILLIGVLILGLIGGGIYYFQSFDKPASVMEIKSLQLCDINEDSKCDESDRTIIQNLIGICKGDNRYHLLADVDADGCITFEDLQAVFPTTTLADETVYTESSRSANWKTYTNNEYSFTLKHPAVWKIKELELEVPQRGTTNKTILFGDVDYATKGELGAWEILISIFPLPIKSVTNPSLQIKNAKEFKDELVEADKRNDPTGNIKVTEINKDTVNGYKIDYLSTSFEKHDSGSYSGYYRNIAVFDKAGVLYLIELNSSSTNSLGRMKIFDQILSTFTFLDQNSAQISCNFSKYKGSGCEVGYECFQGYDMVCGPNDDCSQAKKIGNSLCHKLCGSDNDCRVGYKCENRKSFSGDVEMIYNKMCIKE